MAPSSSHATVVFRKSGLKIWFSMDKEMKCKTCLSIVDEQEGKKDWEAP